MGHRCLWPIDKRMVPFSDVENSWKTEGVTVVGKSGIKVSMSSRSMDSIDIDFDGFDTDTPEYHKRRVMKWLEKFGTVKIRSTGPIGSFCVTLESK